MTWTRGAGFCTHNNEPSVFHKTPRISRVAQQLRDSQDGICCTEVASGRKYAAFWCLTLTLLEQKRNQSTNEKKKLTTERPLSRLAIPELKTKIKCTIMYNVSRISQARACFNKQDQSVIDAYREKNNR